MHIVGNISSTTQLCTVLDFRSEGSIKINHMEHYTGIARYRETCVLVSGMCKSCDLSYWHCFSYPVNLDRESTWTPSLPLKGRQMVFHSLRRLLIQPRTICLQRCFSTNLPLITKTTHWLCLANKVSGTLILLG